MHDDEKTSCGSQRRNLIRQRWDLDSPDEIKAFAKKLCAHLEAQLVEAQQNYTTGKLSVDIRVDIDGS